jgi:hypothetical protein
MFKSATVLERSRWAIPLVAMPMLLAACLGGGGSKEGETAAGASASGTESAPALLPPADLTATAEGFSVTLAWTPPSGGAKALGYEIHKDGALLQAVSASQTTLSDDDVLPGRAYSYEVRTRFREGLVSEGVSADVKIKVPRLKAARVEGDFGVTTRLISKSGYSSWQASTYGWRFRPSCASGPCDVVLRDVFLRAVRAKLQRKGVGYSGEYTGFFTTKCRGTRSTSSVEFALRVARARAIAGEWRATKLVGTLINSETAQFGCVSARAVLRVVAKLRLAG